MSYEKPSDEESARSDYRTFSELLVKWAEAIKTRNPAVHEQYLDPSFVFTSPSGERLAREAYLDIELRVPLPELPFQDVVVQRLSDDIVIVRGSDFVKGDFPGHDVHPEVREKIRKGARIAFTSLWRRSKDRWLAVSNDAHFVLDS